MDVLKVKSFVNGFFKDNEVSWHMQQKMGYLPMGLEVPSYCPAHGEMVTEVKTILVKQNFNRN